MRRNEGSLDLLGYSVRLIRLSEEDGGGWLAEVPELEGCISDGETPHEALINIQDAIKCWIESAKEHGMQIPPPQIYEEPGFSGKFTLRIPKSLHRLLAEQAQREGVSLNQYIVSLISFNAGKILAQNPDKPRDFRSYAQDGKIRYKFFRVEMVETPLLGDDRMNSLLQVFLNPTTRHGYFNRRS